MLVAVDKNPNANAMEEDFAISKSCLDKKKKKKKTLFIASCGIRTITD